MNHPEMRLRLLTNTIMGLMNRIEDKQGKIFSQIDSDLESRIFETIDSKNTAKLNLLVTELEVLEVSE